MLDRELIVALSAPFPSEMIAFLPVGKPSAKMHGTPFLSRVMVAARLNAVVPGEWEWGYELLHIEGPDGKPLWLTHGRLTVCGVTRCDVGEDNSPKGSISDALKRCADLFGVGAYLRRLPMGTGEYDVQRRTWTTPPKISPRAVELAVRQVLCELDVPQVTSTPTPTPDAMPRRTPAPVAAQEAKPGGLVRRPVPEARQRTDAPESPPTPRGESPWFVTTSAERAPHMPADPDADPFDDPPQSDLAPDVLEAQDHFRIAFADHHPDHDLEAIPHDIVEMILLRRKKPQTQAMRDKLGASYWKALANNAAGFDPQHFTAALQNVLAEEGIAVEPTPRVD